MRFLLPSVTAALLALLHCHALSVLEITSDGTSEAMVGIHTPPLHLPNIPFRASIPRTLDRQTVVQTLHWQRCCPALLRHRPSFTLSPLAGNSRMTTLSPELQLLGLQTWNRYSKPGLPSSRLPCPCSLSHL